MSSLGLGLFFKTLRSPFLVRLALLGISPQMSPNRRLARLAGMRLSSLAPALLFKKLRSLFRVHAVL